jgi:RNA polymerase sigma-70 factor (ECF subfamily)
LVPGTDAWYHENISQIRELSISLPMATGWPDRDDHELLEHIQNGSHAAFAELVRRHTERFYRIAYRFLQNKESAEDVVQDAFLKLWEDPAKWRGERGNKFTTWFYRVVTNLSLDRLKRQRTVELDEDMLLVDERPMADESAMRAEAYKQLEKAIAALPERQRIALNLCFDEGLTNQEAADAMGLKLKALQSLIMRAKTTLKERLKAYL